MVPFRADFERWLNACLPRELPSEIAAFSFNLFEQTTESSKFGIEFVGASEFDENDPDWACAEVWEPSQGRSLEIPKSVCSDSWEDCLAKITKMIQAILNADCQLAATLKSVEGVAVSFVDGELHVVHKRR